MNTLTSRTKPISKFIIPTTKTLYISLFSTSSSSPSPSSSSYRRQDEESRGVRVSVWWDIENCGVPNGVNVFRIAHSITSAVRANGIKGPVQITAFGDIFCLNRANQEALSCTGVNLIHIPNGGKNSADRSLLVDLMYWVSQNPPPAHIFLISGDKDFAGILHKLRMTNYNILLAARVEKHTSGVLYSAASIMWYWNELAKGENLSGKHFNQPPDGPFNSWYGHYRGPLEDPFAVFEQQKYTEAEDSSNSEQSSETKLRPVPMAVLRQLRRVVNSHPEGLNITDLRDHLIKSKVPMDKDFYGHKKFSRFLMALPRIVKVESQADGKFFLQPASSAAAKSVDSNDVSAQAVTVNGNKKVLLTAKTSGETPTITRMVDVSEKPSDEIPEKKEDEKKISVEEMPAEETFEKTVLDGSVVDNDTASMTPKEEDDSKQQSGFFKKIWTKLFTRSVDAEQMGDDGVKRSSTLNASSEKSVSEDEQIKSNSENEVRDPPRSSSNTELNLVAKADTIEESEANKGFIAKMLNWCKFWKNETGSDKSIEIPDEKPNTIEEETRKSDDAPHSKNLDDDDASHTRKPELFTKDSFWIALRSFFGTHRGSDIVLNSSSREQIGERLQKEGPLFLQPLQAIDIRHLVDLLFTEKKWIQEFPTKHPRFRLGSLYEDSSTPIPHNTTGLSSIFLNSDSRNNPQLRVSSVVHKKPAEKTRTEVLTDCQKFLDEILSQYPDGFNVSLFKRQFLEKYGYALDHQKLGYPKLVSLLQMIPGVKVESTRIFPDNVVYSPGIQSLGPKEKWISSDSEMSDSAQKDDDVESPWEELGPVAKAELGKDEAKSSVHDTNGVYEPSVIEDDEFSDTEGDADAVKADEQRKSKADEEDSSLLQILDSWYSPKTETHPRDHGSDPEGSPDSSEDETNNPSGSLGVDNKGQPSYAANNGRKHRSTKSYSFVVQGTESKKGKLIDGILGSLKKSGESRVHG
ncbi:hypothetical protein RND81_11G229600 [Saponaria officinalis]|uniref:HTH OST-type domain-containing protein n=1 Tax=Saponaria officinalis TaxID=3572 RepID=A0AAW1HQQ7_SAPOF